MIVPGAADLPSALRVAALLERTAVELVVVLAGDDAPRDAVLVTRGLLRPRWSQGALVLHVQPAAGVVLAPLRSGRPHPLLRRPPLTPAHRLR